MSDLTPAPVPKPVPPTVTVKVARTLWFTSFALALSVVVFVFLSREGQLTRLVGIVTDLQPERAAETIESVATLVFWCTLGALIAMVLIEGLLLRAMLRRHGRVRWALLAVSVVHVAVAVLADAFALVSTTEGMYFRFVLMLQLVLATAAVVAAFLPGAAAWFRAGRAQG